MLVDLPLAHSNRAQYVLTGAYTTAKIFGNSSAGNSWVQWMEARTIMYLKISISDFLTLFSARTRVWFWERRPGYALGVACIDGQATFEQGAKAFGIAFSGQVGGGLGERRRVGSRQRQRKEAARLRFENSQDSSSPLGPP